MNRKYENKIHSLYSFLKPSKNALILYFHPSENQSTARINLNPTKYLIKNKINKIIVQIKKTQFIKKVENLAKKLIRCLN